MHRGRAFAAGVIGALAMSVLMAGLRSLGIPLHIELRLAGILGSGSWIVGLIAHLLIGGLVGLVYMLVFEFVFAQSGIPAGVLVGAINTLLAGFIWAAFDGPGHFWTSFGPLGIMSLFMVHMLYGAVVGGLYKNEHVYVYD